MDCINNGGRPDNGVCVMGRCSIDMEECTDDSSCAVIDDQGQTCEPFPNNCHDASLQLDVEPDGNFELDFEPPGPAGSSRACKQATKNECSLHGCP